MRILAVMPAAKGVYPTEAEKRRVDALLSFARPGVEITVGFPAEPSGLVPFGGPGGPLEAARNHVLVAERMIQAEKEGFDACFPFGMLDFGAELARSVCSIPIVAQAQATYCMAAMMAGRFGVITYQVGNQARARRALQAYGFEQMLVGMGAGGMSNHEMPGRREELFQNFVSEGKRLVKDGAELIVCGGMSMCPVEYPAAAYAEATGVPVLEGIGCAVAMCEAWVNLGTPYSRVRYR